MPDRTHPIVDIDQAHMSERLCGARERWLAFARRRVSPDAAEDVVQAALARALERLDGLRDPSRLEAWFYPILRHAVADHVAQQARCARLSERLELEPTPEPDRLPEAPDLCGCGVNLMKDLVPEQREVLERVVLAEEPVQEVARRMDVTPNTTRVRLHRARHALRAGLEDCCGITTVREAHTCLCPG